MKILATILLLLVINVSCTKRNLNGDKEILVGEWEWVRSDIENLGSTGGEYSVDPLSEQFTASMVFEKRNTLIQKIDGVEQSNGRLIVEYFDEDEQPSLYSWRSEATFKVDGQKKTIFIFFKVGNNDVLYFVGFPFEDTGTTNVRTNVFRRR